MGVSLWEGLFCCITEVVTSHSPDRETGGLGWTPPRLAVAGDAAGGALAVACALRAREGGPQISLQAAERDTCRRFQVAVRL